MTAPAWSSGPAPRIPCRTSYRRIRRSALFRPSLVTFREQPHFEGGAAPDDVERLFVGTRERDVLRRQRQWNGAEQIAFRTEHVHAAGRHDIHTSAVVDCHSI